MAFNAQKFLLELIGNKGYETLEKAIFHNRSSSVSDPLETYLPLIVVPRAILSWLVANVKPMKTGDFKELKFPGKENIIINVNKRDFDVYDAEFIEKGKVIHRFEKQGLPSIGGHLMSVGELYDSFAEETVQNKTTEKPNLDIVRQIIDMNEIKSPENIEAVKWQMSHANVKELTSVIGKLVDALMMKEMNRKKLEEELDKMTEKEVKDEQGKMETNVAPEEKFKRETKVKENDKTIEQEALTYKELNELKTQPTIDQEKPESKEIKTEEGKIVKQSIPETRVTEPAMTPAERPNYVPPPQSLPGHQSPSPKTPITKSNSYFRKKAELLMKPYASEAQRRWAHTEAGTKALGGKESVKHWDKESKGKDLPEKVSKAEMPKGAGQPQKPSMPQPPKPPVPAGNNPAASAAKQAQSSAKGGYKPPHTPGVAMPKNPTAKPKAAAAPKPAGAVKKSDYFKSKLGKSEKYTTTEEELYKSKCPHCEVPEFKKGENGIPIFNPCACFSVMKKNEEGKPYKFVEVIKKTESGLWDLKFHPNADPESVKVFLLTLKAHLLVKRKFDI